MALAKWAIVTAFISACSPTPSARFPNSVRLGTDQRQHTLADSAARFTVIEFFSAHCPCQAEHDARLAALARQYAPLGVSFVAVDSEADANLERDQREAKQRGYSYPILIDPTGSVARSLHADYATYVVLIDSQRQILFQGGIDSDRTHLRADATPYLRNALEDALARQAVRVPEAKTLGCSLMLR